MPGGFRTAAVNTVQSSTTKSAVFTSDTDTILDTPKAEAVDVFVIVTAAGTTMTLEVETSEDGTNFASAKTFAAITATGTFAISLKRGTEPLGTSLRVSGTTVTGSFTFSIQGVLMER